MGAGKGGEPTCVVGMTKLLFRIYHRMSLSTIKRTIKKLP